MVRKSIIWYAKLKDPLIVISKVSFWNLDNTDTPRDHLHVYCTVLNDEKFKGLCIRVHLFTNPPLRLKTKEATGGVCGMGRGRWFLYVLHQCVRTHQATSQNTLQKI
jgi:hypothetical protein